MMGSKLLSATASRQLAVACRAGSGAALGRASAAVGASVALRRSHAAEGGSAADCFANQAAAGTKQPGDEEGGMKTSANQSALPDIGGYGEDPIAAASKASEAAMSEAGKAAEGATDKASDAASAAAGAAAEAARGGVGQAASAARGGVGAAADSVKADSGAAPAADEGNLASRGEAPGTSGHTMNATLRYKKEADDAMYGGAPEPGVVLE